MLRKKKDSMRDIPKDVRHSLEVLDGLLDEFDDEKNPSQPPTLRHPKNVPTFARKSLEILDSVLGEFDIEENRKDSPKSSEDVSEEVNKSLEMLDQVLDEFQSEGGNQTFRRGKLEQGWNESLRKPKHDDVRRSLEVLDSVLAEFDDCLEAWDNLAQQQDESDRIYKVKDARDHLSENNFSTTSFSYDSQSIDGDTSHDSGFSSHEQAKITSPPPVPKRSVTTKLSDRGSGLFTFQLIDSQSFDSLQSESSVPDKDLSATDAISISAKDDDEVFGHNDKLSQADCCKNCGSEIKSSLNHQQMESGRDVSSSPFSERRKMFEDITAESSIHVSPLLERSFNGSSFKVKTNLTKDSMSEPSSLVYYRSVDIDHGDFNQSNFTSKYSPRATKVSPPRVSLLSLPSSFHHAPNCNCKERIRQLQIKFAETRRLLKANKIKGIDHKPPPFIPPPPPEVVAKNSRNEILASNKQSSNESPKSSLISDRKDLHTSNGSTNSISSEENYSSIHSTLAYSEKNLPNVTNPADQKLCRRCSKSSEHIPLSETIEDLPKLLPTDALKRPHLGLSYSMEDDLCPGVKEILQAPSPRNGLSLSRNSKTTSLSTFSLSDTSLGYVSSQSDFELSNSPMKLDKVPVSTIKFSTLPEGMDLHSLPSYYGHDEFPENERKLNLYRDRNFNHTSDPQLRSSSASPLPEETKEKPKKKSHFRAFSRKGKEKKKNGDLKIELVQGKAS